VYRCMLVVLLFLIFVGSSADAVWAQSSEPPAQEVVHIVQKGETMFSIAQRYGLTVDAVAHFNNVGDPRQIYVGQRLVIPVADHDVAVQAVAPYLVQAGDTLQMIARLYHTTWQDLMYINRMVSPSAIYAGQVLQVRVRGEGAAQGASGQSAQGLGTILVVRPGDTMYRTAWRYGVSTWTLAEASRVANPALIYSGQELLIPGDESGLLPVPFVELQVQPLPVKQGQTVLVAVETTSPVTVTGSLFGQEVSFFEGEDEDTYCAVVGVHVFTEPGLYNLDVSAVDDEGRSTRITAGIVVETDRFSYERIDLPASLTNLLDPALISEERERLDAVIHLATPERLWDGNFQRPCAGTVSSYFGSHRSYSDGPYTSYHTGIDFRAPTGTPVAAAAGGTVVLAEPLAIHGNMVVVDHGWGVLTGYAHLSSIDVTVGQRVSSGDLLGKVGNTGQSTGSHLHWEVWAGGTSVNGLQWLDMPSLEVLLE